MIHTSEIINYQGSMQELVEDIGNLRYDALASFFELLEVKMKLDANKDLARGRVQLASKLEAISASICEAKLSSDQAWKISKPYMPKQ